MEFGCLWVGAGLTGGLELGVVGLTAGWAGQSQRKSLGTPWGGRDGDVESDRREFGGFQRRRTMARQQRVDATCSLNRVDTIHVSR